MTFLFDPKAIQSEIAFESGRKYSVSTINKGISQFNYTLKNVKNVPERRNTPSTIEDRYNFAFQLVGIDRTKLLYIDEAGISVAYRIKRGRSLIGTTC